TGRTRRSAPRTGRAPRPAAAPGRSGPGCPARRCRHDPWRVSQGRARPAVVFIHWRCGFTGDYPSARRFPCSPRSSSVPPRPALGVQLPVALPGPKEYAVEVETGEPQVGADLLLVLLGDVEAEEDLLVSLGGQVAEDLAGQRGALLPEEAFQRA